jgi:hypothetical protein
VEEPVVWMRRPGVVPGVEDIDPDRREGSNALCLRRNSSSVMISSTSCSLPSIDEGVDLDIGGVYGRGVWRIGGMYGTVGRRLEEVENCEVFEVERLWRPRLFMPVKLTSETDLEYSVMPKPARPSFSAAGLDRSSEWASLADSLRR